MANKHTKTCSTFLTIREMHIKTVVRYQFIPSMIGRIKDRQQQVLVSMWRNWSPHTLLVGMKNGAVTLRNRLAVPQTIKHRATI